MLNEKVHDKWIQVGDHHLELKWEDVKYKQISYYNIVRVIPYYSFFFLMQLVYSFTTYKSYYTKCI